MLTATPYFQKLRSEIARRGGLFNAHLHLCRAGTLEETERLLFGRSQDGISHLSLAEKHGIIPLIHASSAYEVESLRARLDDFLDLLEAAGTTRAHTLVDITDDRVQLSAFEVFLRAKQERRARLDLHVGAYSPLGFTDQEPRRWALIEEAAAAADLLGSLPERDDRSVYPNNIGYEESCRRVLLLGQKLGKPIHIHVDQKNDASEHGAETLLSVIDRLGLSYPRPEPMVWLVHLISPSTYLEARFEKLAAALASRNIGVICCPSAAISMRQLRPLMTPTFNSIARVLELIAAGVQVRIGSDNICDITSPAGTTDLVDELFVLANAIRFYDIDILAKIGAGEPLNALDRAKVAGHLRMDAVEVERAVNASESRGRSLAPSSDQGHRGGDGSASVDARARRRAAAT